MPPGTNASHTATPQDEHFPLDAGDPVARFLRRTLRMNWPHLLIAAFLLYGPIEKFVLPYFGKYIFLPPDIRDWRPDVETLFQGFICFPAIFAIYLWIGADISRVFQTLKDNHCFDKPQLLQEFTGRARAAFARWWWWAFGAAVTVGIVLWINFGLWGPASPVKAWWDDLPGRGPLLFPRLVSLVMVGMLAYVVSQIVIREALAIVWWRRLWRRLGDHVELHPYHSDGAAGFGAFGQHAVGVSYFLLAVTAFALMGSLLPSIRYGNRVIYAASDTVRVQMAAAPTGVPQRADSAHSVSYVVRKGDRGRATITFVPDSMALGGAGSLHLRVVRLPWNTVALDDWYAVPADSVPSRDRIASPPLLLHAPAERFEVTIETTPLPGGVPTLRVAGFALSLWSPLVLGLWVFVLAAFGLSLGPLLLPAHDAMARALNRQLDALSRDLDHHLSDAQTHRRSDPAKFALAMEAVTLTKQIRATLLEDSETWPLSAQLRRRLRITSGLSVGSSTVNLVAAGGLNLLRQIT